VTALDNAGVHRGDVAAIIGHERGFTPDTYSGGKGLIALASIIEKVEYPGFSHSVTRLSVKRQFAVDDVNTFADILISLLAFLTTNEIRPVLVIFPTTSSGGITNIIDMRDIVAPSC
jgi:hypothetical protein